MSVKPTTSTLMQRYWSLLLILCLIQFSGFWIYPPSTSVLFDNLAGEKYLGVPFQRAVWALVMLSFVMHVMRRGFGPIMSALKVFIPFWLLGLISGVFGYNPIGSTWMVILWTIGVVGPAILGLELRSERADKLIYLCLVLFMVASVVLALAVPSLGQQVYGFTMVWRGGFSSKNTLGWVAALTLATSVAMMQRHAWRWPAAAIVLSLLCLVGSGSKGALVAALATLAYLYLINKLAQRVTPGLGVFLVLFFAVTAAVSALLVAPLILEALGRDATLTGRTDVWSSYFYAMVRTPWLGDGPGAYTGLSPLTMPLANKLSYLGTIVTPHNVYLGVFGDTGLFGLLAYLGAMLYLSLVRPLSQPSRYAKMTAAVGFLVLAHGLVETHEVFAQGLAWVLLFFGHAADQQQRRVGAAPAITAATAPTRAGLRTPMVASR